MSRKRLNGSLRKPAAKYVGKRAPGNNSAEDKDGISSIGKPAFALFHSARESSKRGAFKPSAPKESEPARKGLHPRSKCLKSKRRTPTARRDTRSQQQPSSDGGYILQHEGLKERGPRPATVVATSQIRLAVAEGFLRT